MEKANLEILNDARDKRRAVALVNNMSSGQTQVVHSFEAVKNPMAEALAKAFQSGKSALCEIDGEEIFINVYLPPTRLVVIGAVHISQVLAKLASDAGFALEIIDPRTAFATPERFQGVQIFPDWPQKIFEHSPLDAYCALIALTHDPKIDDDALRSAMDAGCFYIGALGSRKTHVKRRERLVGEGVSSAALDQIHAPIGMDIGAANPAEIAVAILAQVIEAFRLRSVT